MGRKNLIDNKLNIVGAILAGVAYLMVTVPQASATKASSGPLNFSILFSDFRLGVQPAYCPGQSVSYNVTVENPNATADHSVVFNTTFPQEVTCSTVAPTSGCTLSGSHLSCNLGTLNPKQRVAFTVHCQVNTTAVLGTTAKAWASVTSANVSSSNQGYLAFLVTCATPPVTPTVACSPTPVPPTPTPVCTNTPTPAPICVETPTSTPTLTPTPTWTSTPTPECTGTPVPPTATPVPCTPTTCHHSQEPDDSDCETYAIKRKVQERWSRNGSRPVAIYEQVDVLPAGEDLACLATALQSQGSECLSYGQFGTCSDPLLRRHLAREGYDIGCFGVSNLTNWLLNQACNQDSASAQCSQFLALNTYQSNNYPLGSESSGVELCADHNPRSQLFIIDSQCRLILNPTEEQKSESCPAAIIQAHSYSQGVRKRSRR